MATPESTEIPASPPAGPTLSPLQRAIAVFVRPAEAWTGLVDRVQWWFPMIVALLVSVLSAAVLHQRAIVPMMMETWDRQVASGQLDPAQLDRMEQFFTSPTGTAIIVGQQAIAVPLMMLAIALVVWFAVAFILGTRFRYRLALEVVSWSSLITIPTTILVTALGWMKQNMRGVHVGFGILLPEADPPSKLLTALGVILDALGPLSIWYLVVGILGAAALSGAPRRSVAWTMGALYAVLLLLFAGLAALFVPAA
jgi:hypothetical protein